MVGEHRALGHAGGATGVLEEGDVLCIDVDLRQCVALALDDDLLEADGAGDVVIGHRLLDVLEHEVDDRALGKTHQVADTGGDHLPQWSIGHDLLHGVAEIVHHQQHRSAGVDQLVLEFARRVERIDVHHGQAGT